MPKTRPTLSTIFTEPGFWILFAITIAFFYRPLFNNETFFFRDLNTHFYPQKKLFAELVHSGQLPLWDPYTQGGQPFLANMNNSVMYPSNLLYLFLGTVTAFNIDIVLHVLLAALSAYFLARLLNLSMIASFTCGIIYAFCGPTLSVTNVWLYAPFHLPLMLALWHLYCVENKNRWFVAVAIIGSIQVFAGRSEISAITVLMLFLWTLFFSYENKLKKISRFFILQFFIFGLSAIQIIPMMDLIQQSAWGQDIDPNSFFASSVDPTRYFELVIPNLPRPGVPYLLNLYFGVPVLILAILGGVNKISDENFPRNLRILFVFLIAISLMCIASRHHAFFSFLALLPITLLAGCQLNYWMGNPDEKITRFGMALIMGTATILTIFTLYCFVFPRQAEVLLTSYFGNSAIQGFRHSMLHAAASALLFVSLIILKTLNSKLKVTIGVAILIVLDLLFAGSAINQYAPRKFLTTVPDLATLLKKEIGNRRLFRDGAKGSLHDGLLYGIPVVFHEDYDGLAFSRMIDLNRTISKLDWQQRLPILSSAAVRFVLTSQHIQLPDLKQIRTISSANGKQYFLYTNLRCAPRTTFVTNSKVQSTSSELLRLMSLPSFDPCKNVLLEETPIATNIASGNATVKLLDWQTTSSTHLVNTDKPGLLVFSEPFTNGWRWKVDDWNVKPLRANYAFSAVSVPAGKHYVKRTYHPVSVTLGFAVSLTSLVFLGLYTFANIRIRNVAESAAPALE